MVELSILSGKQAGNSVIVRRFPFRVGRFAEADLRLEDQGVFERHFELRRDQTEGFVLLVQPHAYAAVNGQTAQRSILKSGDVISAGSVKISFALAPAAQRDLRVREAMIWVGLALLCGAQIALVYLLME